MLVHLDGYQRPSTATPDLGLVRLYCSEHECAGELESEPEPEPEPRQLSALGPGLEY